MDIKTYTLLPAWLPVTSFTGVEVFSQRSSWAISAPAKTDVGLAADGGGGPQLLYGTLPFLHISPQAR